MKTYSNRSVVLDPRSYRRTCSRSFKLYCDSKPLSVCLITAIHRTFPTLPINLRISAYYVPHPSSHLHFLLKAHSPDREASVTCSCFRVLIPAFSICEAKHLKTPRQARASESWGREQGTQISSGPSSARALDLKGKVKNTHEPARGTKVRVRF